MIRNVILLTLGIAIGVSAGFSAAAARSPETGLPPLRLVALGDSITAGYGVEPMKTYPELVARDLGARSGRDVVVSNLGVNGLRTGELQELLRTDPQYRDAVAAADVITIGIGTNDLSTARGAYYRGTCGGPDNRTCLSQARRTFRDQLAQIADEILRLKKGDAKVVLVDVYLFYFNDTGMASRFSPPLDTTTEVKQPGMLLRWLNDYVRATAEGMGFGFASVRGAFNGESGVESPLARGMVLPQPDGVHPSARGHTAIAEAVLEALEE
ncbi:MAG: SGNH/GDSL hydrolase family protein [Chloroflexi bacterium]|nr:SGNH/GDSL hydrolase family protein [Chloroflexota bacterium]